MLWHILKCFLFPSSHGSKKSSFLWESLWGPGRAPGPKTHKRTCPVHDGLTLEVLTHRFVHIEFPAVCLPHFRFPYPRHSSWGSFSSWVSILTGCNYLYSFVCFSNLGAGGNDSLPCDLISLMDLTGIDFSVYSAFYLLVRWNGGFWAPYRLDCNPGLLNIHVD